MNKFNQFLKDHGSKIIIVLLLLIYFKACSVDTEVNRVKKDLRTLTVEVDSLTTEFNAQFETLPDAYDLRLEGLKVEKRMIQSTNRKMLDVERQNVIEREITRLEKLQTN